MKRQVKTGDEEDALTRWRHWYNWRPGVRSAIKRGTRRRERREAKQEIRKSEIREAESGTRHNT